MSGERLHYGIERQRHDGFVGREALLARLDELLTAADADRWVVVTGGPGMGKSALLAAWLARREAAGAAVPHHFIRRGQYDWDDPAKLVGSLIAQLEERYPDQREQDADARIHPAARLAAMLERVSDHALAPRGERLAVLIDGLDEYDPPAGAPGADPLAAFLPHVLPRGVSFLCASRPKHPYVEMLAARDGELVQIDLDEADLAADNEATVRAFWERAAPSLGLDARFVAAAVERAGGNLQHAATLRKHLAGLPPERRRVEDIPRGLAALLERTWQRIATEPAAVRGLGLLCAAREALTLDELGAVAGWADEAPRQAFLRGARELLIEARRPDGPEEYRLHHDSIRAHIAKAIGASTLRGHHAALAQRLATWPGPAEADARRYALRHALLHRVEAGDWAGAWRLAADMSFLEAKNRELGAHELEVDVAHAAERCRASGDEALRGRFDDLVRALGRESHWLRAAPEATAALVWNRLRRLGWSADEIDRQLQIPAGARFLRVRHVASRESPALVRELIGHSGPVIACAVTPDGLRVVSASADHTLKVWDLASGRELSTLQGHADRVSGCAVTADGRRLISASADQTLKVWDLESGRELSTLRGHAARVIACAVTSDGRRVVSASLDHTLKVWDLESGGELSTLRGHVASVNACAVIGDGGRVVSASDDQTLKVWDLASGRELSTLQGHVTSVTACAVTRDGRRVVSTSDDWTLKVWDLESGRALSTLQGHTASVSSCVVTADGRRVISASYDQTLKVWDLESGRELFTLQGHTTRVRACAVTFDGLRIVSTSDDNTLKVWDLESGRELSTLQGHAAIVRECTVTADGRHVVSASNDRTLKVWDLESGRELATLQGHTTIVRACKATPEGRRVVSVSWDNTIKVWDLESRREVATLQGHSAMVKARTVTSDGRRMVSVSWDDTVKVWDLESGRELATLQGRAYWVNAYAHPDRDRSQLSRHLKGRDHWANAYVVTPDGQRVISASWNNTVKIWDLESGRELVTLQGHADRVNACAVTADGRRVVTASADKTLKVWDLESGRELATLRGHADWVRACAVTADGQRVVSASMDNTLKVWDLVTGACLMTHRANAGYSTVTATETAIIAGDVTGAVWFLDWPPSEHRERAILDSSGPAAQPRSDSNRASNLPRPPMQPTQKHTILFLAANPIETAPLALDREAHAIHKELQLSGFRDRFELVTRWAVEPLDLLRELVKLKPTVVHFSGHGGQLITGQIAAGQLQPGPEQSPRRDIAGALDDDTGERRHGLFFQGADGRARFVSAQALEETFGAAGSSVKLVVLSACYSDVQAAALLAHVDCVIGMSGAILDAAARSFAIGFYGGLGGCESVAAAYKQGRAAISLDGLPDSALPQLKVRAGVDASRLVLATDPR